MQLTRQKILIICFAISAYIIIFFLVRQILPDPKTLLAFIESLYKSHGYIVVFIGAVIEGIFLVGNYFPGSTVIFAGSALAAKGIVSFPYVLALSIVGLNIAYVFNYFLGKHGWYHVLEKYGLHESLLKAEEKIKKNEARTFFLGFSLINIASILSTAAGVIKIPLKRFLLYAFAFQIFWSTVWGTVAYLFGLSIIDFINNYFGAFVFVIGLIWIVRYILKNS